MVFKIVDKGRTEKNKRCRTGEKGDAFVAQLYSKCGCFWQKESGMVWRWNHVPCAPQPTAHSPQASYPMWLLTMEKVSIFYISPLPSVINLYICSLFFCLAPAAVRIIQFQLINHYVIKLLIETANANRLSSARKC